ncbi:MAG TPA: hypothetical protein PLR88_00495 [Bacteroidales bacterium]|nr:hypothetical protein [Bacteroidales bacterium]
MGKRSIITILVFLISGLAILGYFLQHGKMITLSDPYKAVDYKACIVIETVDLRSFLNSLTTGKGIFGEACKVKEFDKLNLKLKYLADYLNKPAFTELLSKGSCVFSFTESNDGKLEPLLSIAVTDDISRHLKEILLSSDINQIIEERKGRNKLYKIPYFADNRKDTAYLSVISGLLVCSSSEDIIDRTITRIRSDKDVRDLPGFSKVYQASGKNEDKIFLIFPNMENMLNSFFKETAEDIWKIVKIEGVLEGDIVINEDGLILNGYTAFTDTTRLLYDYQHLSPIGFHTFKILPSSTMLFETRGFLRDTAESKTVEHEAVKNRLAATIKEYAGEEITRSFMDIKGSSLGNNELILYELTNTVQAEQAIVEELGAEKEVFYFKPDKQTRIPVYKTRSMGLAECLVPGLAPGFDDSYFTFYNDFMITASSDTAICEFLNYNILNKTLANDLTYRDFESSLPSRGGCLFYCVPSGIINYLAELLNDNIVKGLKSNKNSIHKIQAAGYQLASSNNMIYNSISVRYKESTGNESTIEWKTMLDTVSGTRPFFFTNHNTGAREIFIQDLKNNVYLINAAGRILWKVKLREKIRGNVYIIDYFQNGKYQLLFSGENYLHLLDRNGNYVKKYPVKLKSPATNSLTLVDYDNNHNYRIFIACEDRMIYSYEKSGNLLKGWTPFKTSGKVKSEINYYRVSGKDYLVASDEKSVYFLDRAGKKRVDLKENVTRAAGSAMKLSTGPESYLVCTSPDGTVQHIYFDGNVVKFNIKKFSDDHLSDFFDIDSDGFGEYVFIEKGMLYLYDNNRSEIFEIRFDSENLTGLFDFVFSNSSREVGVYDAGEKLIYMIDENGETMRGFPLPGGSMFSIGKLSEERGWYILTGGADNFLYNYKIDSEIK